MFLSNLARFAPNSNVKAISMSSERIRDSRIFDKPLRFFSIDGGHTRALTFNDLEIANEFLTDEGMCCLDDIMNPSWTGVISGLFEFTRIWDNLVPFALMPNKLFLCRPSYQRKRRQQFKATFHRGLLKADSELGSSVIDVYGDCWTALGFR